MLSEHLEELSQTIVEQGAADSCQLVTLAVFTWCCTVYTQREMLSTHIIHRSIVAKTITPNNGQTSCKDWGLVVDLLWGSENVTFLTNIKNQREREREL